MKIDYIDYGRFRGIVFAFKYSPEPLHILIFLTNSGAARKLYDIIVDLVPDINIDFRKNYIRLKNNKGNLIEIIGHDKRVEATCGARADIVIGDSEYPLSDFYEILCPLANVGPWQLLYSIDSYEVISKWDEIHKKKMKEIDLED